MPLKLAGGTPAPRWILKELDARVSSGNDNLRMNASSSWWPNTRRASREEVCCSGAECREAYGVRGACSRFWTAIGRATAPASLATVYLRVRTSWSGGWGNSASVSASVRGPPSGNALRKRSLRGLSDTCLPEYEQVPFQQNRLRVLRS